LPESITSRATVIGSIVMMTLWWICTAGSDQMAIQRYLSTRDVKAARKCFLVTGLANVVVGCFLAALGLALMSLYQANPELFEGLGLKKDADKLFPYYIIRGLPIGVTGLVISGLLAAAMSSLSSGINSSCSVIRVDFIDRFRKRQSSDEQSSMKETKVIAVFCGVAAVLLSLIMGKVTGNITEVTTRTNHLFTAPLFGLFFMALFVKKATPVGTLAGAIAGCAVGAIYSYWEKIPFLNQFTDGEALSFQWITLASLVAFVVVAIPVSWMTRRAGAKTELEQIDEPVK
jgi:SSS family solute:Na+ symporter